MSTSEVFFSVFNEAIEEEELYVADLTDDQATLLRVLEAFPSKHTETSVVVWDRPPEGVEVNFLPLPVDEEAFFANEIPMARESMWFFVEGKPLPQGSKNAYVRGGRAVMVEASAGLKGWRQAIVDGFRSAIPDRAPLQGPIELRAQFVFERPQSHLNAAKDAPLRSAPQKYVRTPDTDKLVRAVGDALKIAGAYKDDSQITRVFAEKRYAEHGELQGVLIELVFERSTAGV